MCITFHFDTLDYRIVYSDQIIINKYTVARIPAGCRFSNRLLTAGKESGGLRSVEDKQVQGPMSSRRHSLHGAMNEMKEHDGREV